MEKPVLLSVDDEPMVLNAIERDLRRQYHAQYRIVKAGSGADALNLLRGFKQRAMQVALLLVDQRMPGMTGTELLLEARALYPDARKVLLTAYADTDAAIASINKIGLDYYLMKPWNPPEQYLYPVLDDLLDDWRATAHLPYDGIRLAGTLWSATSHRSKDFLALNQIPYKWLDIEQDTQTRALVESLNPDQVRLPVIFFPDGTTLIAPENRELADKLKLQVQVRQPFYDLIVIGGGPAGLAAAVYGASEGLRTVLLERHAIGGQAGTSSRIENYLGFPNGLSGADLARRAGMQAQRLGAELVIDQTVARIKTDDPYRLVELRDGAQLSCHALLIATGVSVRRFEVPGARELEGAGVYYGAALTEAANYAGQHVFVVGGANSAGQAAMFFSRYAQTVTMLVRAGSLAKSMSTYLIDQIAATPNIEVLPETEATAVRGTDRVQSLILTTAGDAPREVPAAAVFIFIGAVAHTEMVAGVVERDASGFIVTGPDLSKQGERPRGWTLRRDPYLLETSVPGIFAAGDVRYGSVKRVASAVGEGAVSVSLIHQYLKTV